MQRQQLNPLADLIVVPADARSAQLPVCVLIRPWVFSPTRFQKLADHIGALHKDVGLLGIVIGILVNAGDAGYLAQPNATREILTAVIDQYESEAPLSAMQLRAALNAPIGSPPPNGGRRLRIVQGEKTTA